MPNADNNVKNDNSTPDGQALIRRIPAEQARLLRSQILRPGLPLELNVYPGDDDPETFILGAFEGQQFVGTLSIFHQPTPNPDNPHIWRLRGVATVSEVRGKGYAVQMMRQALAYVAHNGGIKLWCNARSEAVGFYLKLGFYIEGEEQKSHDTGPYYFMWREITPADAQYSGL